MTMMMLVIGISPGELLKDMDMLQTLNFLTIVMQWLLLRV